MGKEDVGTYCLSPKFFIIVMIGYYYIKFYLKKKKITTTMSVLRAHNVDAQFNDVLRHGINVQ